MWPRSVKSYALIRVDDVSFQAVPCFNMFAVCTCMLFEHMVVGPKLKGLGTRIFGPCEDRSAVHFLNSKRRDQPKPLVGHVLF